ncbi:MAG: (R)-mandelonitrile lyase [Solidesulfovibrio sp. DCME]|uniref:(R)-mandelonitrile lyase n=1 Tax=Solidesulfovibrio sp. DCME TaxID=3447380 RepID=UPI003D0FA21C
MEIHRAGSQASLVGAGERYTGAVRIDPLFPEGQPPSKVTSTVVTFEPGARTVWHTHPLGQTLIVTAGWCRVQCHGGPVAAIGPGDVVRILPGERHWHGASPATAMSHIAIQEERDGSTAQWLEPVDEAQYAATP